MNTLTVTIRTGKDNMDIPVIHDYLSTDSYWAQGISYALVEGALAHSFCIGAFVDGQQVAFARLITDYHTFGWLADVFVLPAYRGNGISKQLMAFLQEQPWTKGLRRIMLSTLDAHELYRQYGFNDISKPSSLMEIYRPGIHRHFTLTEATRG